MCSILQKQKDDSKQQKWFLDVYTSTTILGFVVSEDSEIWCDNFTSKNIMLQASICLLFLNAGKNTRSITKYPLLPIFTFSNFNSNWQVILHQQCLNFPFANRN